MTANRHFSDAIGKWFYSVSQNKSYDEPEWRWWPGSSLQQPIWFSNGSPIRFHSGVILSKIVQFHMVKFIWCICNDVMFQCLWRHSCQFKRQKFCIIFWRALVPPTLIKVPPPMQFMKIFLILPKLEWSFSNWSKIEWGCWNSPNCFWFTQIFLILPKLWWSFCTLPKFIFRLLDLSNWFQFTQMWMELCNLPKCCNFFPE